MASKIIASIPDAMDNLETLRDCYSEYEDKVFLRVLMHKLRGLRTFLLCLKKMDSTEDNSDSDSSVEEGLESDLQETQSRDDNSEASQLESLLERIEDLLHRIEDNEYLDGLLDIESLEEEIDRWYTSLSDYLPQASSSPVANQVEEIFSSILRNLEDFLSLHIAYAGAVVAPLEALKVNITFWRNFLHFATFLGTEQLKEFPDFLTYMEGLAFSAAHFTVHIFSDGHYNTKVFSESEHRLRKNHYHGNVYGDIDDLCAQYSSNSSETSYDRIRSTVSALLLRINPLDNPRLYESYTQVLESMKCSRESYVVNLDIKESSDLLLSMLWEVLQFPTGPVAALKDKLQELYEGFGYLRVLIKKHSNKFDGEVGAITRAAIFDVGVIIFSVYQNPHSINHEIEEFLGMIKVIRKEVEEQVVSTAKFNFPKATALAFLDFLLNYLMEVKSSNLDSDTPSCACRIREHIIFLRSFMEKMVKLKDHHEAVWNFAVEVAYKIELLIDQLVLGDIPDSDVMSLQSITEDMEIIKTDSAKIIDDRREEPEVPQEVTSTNTDHVTSQSSIPSADDFVGFEDERISIMDRLTRGSKKLQVVAIVGMPGLGKTTLATKVYNEPSVQQHFHVRAWCSISQEFNKRKVLLELLNQIPVLKSDESSDDDYSKKSEDELAQKLRRSLLRRRYLIYIDDVWDIKAFECLKLSFPSDSSGRILLTSRIGDVAKLDDNPHFLRQLTISESLELLQKKVSPGKGWPQSLYGIAVKIAENCNGLPLIITIVSGLLATAKQDVWEEVLGSLTSGIISSTDQCERTIELSYKHLPEHLKPCFLSFGSFPEDEEISVKRLIWLWMAEGLVRKNDSRSLEEVATSYLDNLIGRSLVMESEKRIGGGIKACRIHDLLLDFCLRKANEENLSLLLNGKDKLLPIEESRNLRRLCVHSKMEDFMDSKLLFPRLRSLSFFGDKTCKEVTDISFISRVYKLLRVLNMEKVRVLSYDFPGEIGLLVQLRYLAISVTFDISPSIGNLSYLETLILDPVRETLVTMPDTFWNLQKLRHLHLNNMRDGDDFHGIILPVDNLESSCNLLELENLSGLHSEEWGSMENQLKKFPNIRQLKLWLYVFENDHVNGSKVMSFSFLSRLESLSLSFDDNSTEFDFIFPESIKKLNLSRCYLSWERISRIAKLPNLEVLKLLDGCFVGERWQVEEGEFSKLRFLKLEYLDVIKWTGCDDQFPNLEKLVVVECNKLEEIPECLENVETLEMIEVIECSDDVESLFETLANYLKDMGNSVLQFHVRSSKEKVSTGELGSTDDEGSVRDEDSASEEGSANEEDN